MALDLVNYRYQAQRAVKEFWGNREAAIERQRKRGVADQGQRGAVTAGKNMEGFLSLLADLVDANGLRSADIIIGRQTPTIPGYFRPTKIWDLLVINQGKLIAVVECKSHVGSFGNNFNNRCEEAVGSATDFWTAYREGAFGNIERPFVGYLTLVQDSEESRRPVRIISPNFPVFSRFKDTSYAQRYDHLCRSLIQEQLYGSASVILSPKSADSGDYSEMSEMTSLRSFVATFAGHIAAEASRTS